ncbi:Exocyst complex component S5 [Rhizina undulata]
MADYRSEAALLKQYRLQDPYPESWSDPIEDLQAQQRKQLRASTSRYSVLQEEGIPISLKGLVGGDLFSGGVVPEDEPDPLGSTDSVVRVLKKRGLPVDENSRLRNRYLISSKTFSPPAFLRDVHANTTSPQLEQGLSHLSSSIAQKSGSLKQLVESNFDRFVAAKGTIEGVYKEMKDNSFLDQDKESEYGVGKIRGHLNEAGTKALDIFGPVMKGRGREEGLRVVLAAVDKHRNMLEMPGILTECIKRKDYEALIEDYQKAQAYHADARALMPATKGSATTTVKEEHIHQLIIAEKMWTEVTLVIDDFKRETWKRLVDCKTEDNAHMELISILLELGVGDNPIWVWLLSRYEYLKNKITSVFERSRMEIEALRRKVAQASAPTPQAIAHHLRSPTRRVLPDAQKALDTSLITSLWDLILYSLAALLDPSNGILGELLNFWKTAQGFIDGDNLLPVGIDDQSRKFHKLADDDVRALREGAAELVNSIKDCMIAFFQEPPVEDISAIYSNIPMTPMTPGPGEYPPSPVPPAPKMRGQIDGEEEFAFLPPGANSLSGVYYMSRVIVLVGNAAVAMAEIISRLGKDGVAEKLRIMVSGARERAVVAVCGGWLKDAQNCKVLEDWTRALDNRDVTKMPGAFLAFEREVISGMQGMVYLSQVKNSNSAVIPPPSAKLLTHVRAQFVRSLYKALQGMVENSKKLVNSDEWDDEKNGLASPVTHIAPKNLTAQSVDSQDKNVRMLLTLSNLQLLKADVVPELIMQFETSFSVKLTDESKTLKDALSQIDAQLFDEYTKPIVKSVCKIVRGGILTPEWSPPPGKLATEVKPYIYEALLVLVQAHSQVTITAPSLVQPVLSYLLEQLSKELLESIKQRKRFTLGELLQATLDVEFVNQTLSQFNTSRSSEYQQNVYVELDKGSDAEARQGLQKELGGMKTILSQLRKHSRAEFLCFRAKKSSSRNKTQTEL